MNKPPLWPAHLHHFSLDTSQMNTLIPWYETRTFNSPAGEWKTEPRTLNLWGDAWTRD